MDDLRLRRAAVTSLGLVLGAALLAGPAFAQAPDISGTYWATEYHPKIQIVGGGELPLYPRGQGGLREEHGRPEGRHSPGDGRLDQFFLFALVNLERAGRGAGAGVAAHVFR